jgi:hypothetical protein
MSKWINKDLFDDFRKEKVEEKESSGGGVRRSEMIWDTPQRGTTENPKIYEGRFLQHPSNKPYMKYYYHMWQSGENWIFVLCPKTGTQEDFKNFCPLCSANIKLYNGTGQDKKQAYAIKRKERFVGNWYIVKDPRDAEKDDENKVTGKVKLYEFPLAVEKKLKNEIIDSDEGYGDQIFDPSENGRNFIVKVLSTKKDEDGKQWPDYSSSTFSRSQSSLGNDEEIEKIMEQCINLKDYISSMVVPKDKMVEILKNEFLWDLVEEECLKNGYKDVKVDKPKEAEETEAKEEAPKEDDPPWDTGEEETPKEDKKEETPKEKETKEVDVDDLNDDDLLAELDNM